MPARKKAVLPDERIDQLMTRRVPQAPQRGHLDEMCVKINGEMHDLWRPVDHEGEEPESFVTKTHDKKAALKF